MLTLPYELYTAKQTREIDHLITTQHAISVATLMARAGSAALTAIKTQWPDAKHLLIICGTGNNGGDGFELATQALNDSYHVTVYQVGSGDMSQETEAARNALINTGTPIHRFEADLPASDIVIDAVFGTGLNRTVEGLYNKAIAAINQQRLPVLSLDIPSGLDADTGLLLGNAVKATATLSYIGLNIGLFVGEGPNVTGMICFNSLNAPADVYRHFSPIARRVNLEQNRALLKPRLRTGHKGLYGHLLVIGGDMGMSGASRLAAEAGARVGAGLISIATHASHSATLNLNRPELMCHSITDQSDISTLLARVTTLTLGPGLGQGRWGKNLFEQAIASDLDMVVDADALNLLSQTTLHSNHWVLTPHPGEAARLLGWTSHQVQADRINAAKQLQKQYGGVIVLKGAGTLICDGCDPIRLSNYGNPGMASGGMGDVLAGVIGGLLAQGLSLMDAACLGVMLHGMAGDKAAEKDGGRGMLAMDLIPYLRHLVNPSV